MPLQHKPLHASLVLAKASLKATLRSPTSVVFSLLFPIIFIVVFGSMVDNTIVELKVALAKNCDTSNGIYKAITNITNITIDSSLSQQDATDALKKGRLTAILNIQKDAVQTQFPHYNVYTTSSTSSADANKLLQTLLTNAITSINTKIFPSNLSAASLHNIQLPGRTYRQIDFILPGQLGFSLLMAGVFGSAFILFSLRKTLVLKRLSATPISRTYIILGEFLSRFFFQLISFTIMIALGYFAFHFTLINGLFTVLEMLAFSVLGLIIFMGMGFIISGVVQNESAIAPIANTVTLPQILLCGLFFPIENYPYWLQQCCNILPLTFFVDGMRKIAFENTHIWQMPAQIIGLCIWAILITMLCVKLFKWE
ncbi:MAG TPA: ABC transporter permease [Parafilimonas sp.]|nr:ABC transporter permease [Parafilimonas sp.]